MTKIPQKPKNYQNTHKNLKMTGKYPQNLKITKIPLNLKNYWNNPETYKMTKIPPPQKL